MDDWILTSASVSRTVRRVTNAGFFEKPVSGRIQISEIPLMMPVAREIRPKRKYAAGDLLRAAHFDKLVEFDFL